MSQNKPKRVLHISNWHPNRENPFEAIWMHRHVQTLVEHCENEVWHIQVRPQKKWKYHKYTDDYNCKHRVLDIPFRQWAIVEILTTFLLCWHLTFSIKKKKFDVLNVHIAYPLLTYWKTIRFFVRIPVVISEHWSAYHFNFGLPKDTNKLNRIKKIFRHQIPLITVSKALATDIEAFANVAIKKQYVLPNVIDTDLFYYKNGPIPKTPVFFMLSGWAPPKQPIVVIHAFVKLLEQHPDALLKIAGFGLQLNDMKKEVERYGISNNVVFLGKLEASAIADLQQDCSAFIHCSDYETFSVVCAEAICCGTPVIASAVGGIVEFISPENGMLVAENRVELWTDTLTRFLEKEQAYDRNLIAQNAAKLLSISVVGEKYINILEEVQEITSNKALK